MREKNYCIDFTSARRSHKIAEQRARRPALPRAAGHPGQQSRKEALEVHQHFFPRSSDNDFFLLPCNALQYLPRTLVRRHSLGKFRVHFSVLAAVATERGQADFRPDIPRANHGDVATIALFFSTQGLKEAV